MGLFSKKQKIDYDVVFKEQYKSINQLMSQAQQENDYVIKESILTLVVQKYNELLDLIDKGAAFDRMHFLSLQQSAQHELELVRSINKDQDGH